MQTDVEDGLEEFLPAPYPAPLFVAREQELDFGEVRKPGRKRLSFKISNIGGEGNLEVTLSPNQPDLPWFEVRPSQVVIAAGEDCIVDVEIDASRDGCGTGRKEIDIQVDAPASMVQPIPRIRVTAEILPEIRLLAEPAEADLGDIALGESQTVTVTISRSDQREVSLNERRMEVVDDRGTRRPAWAHLSLGPAGRQQSVQITVHTANRAEGEYRCELRLEDVKPEVKPVSVPIRFRVTRPPQLQLQWQIEPLPMFAGDMQEAQLAVGNTGGGVLRGRISGDRFWLRALNGAFEVRPGDIHLVTVQIGDSRQKPGVYHGSLEIASNDGGRDQVLRLPVQLTVEGDTSSPFEVKWEEDLGELTWGKRAERVLTVRNRMSRPFEGRVVTDNPEWLRPREAGGSLRLGPGATQRVTLEVRTRPLTAAKGGSQHQTAVRVLDSAGRERWSGAASLTLLPARWLRLLRAALILAALLLLALAARRYLAPARDGAARRAPAPLLRSTGSLEPGHAALAPETAEWYYQKGRVYYNRRRWAAAAEAFRAAARVDPSPARSYLALGQSRYQMRQYAAAAGALKEALRLKPSSVETHIWLAKAYRRLGQKTKARLELREALRYDPHNQQARMELAQLR